MFLERQTSHESLLTFVALSGPVTVTLTSVNRHGVCSDEAGVAGLAGHQTLLGCEGWVELRV